MLAAPASPTKPKSSNSKWRMPVTLPRTPISLPQHPVAAAAPALRCGLHTDFVGVSKENENSIENEFNEVFVIYKMLHKEKENRSRAIAINLYSM